MNKQKSGMVSLVGAGPGDPGLITLRGLECLVRSDVVVYDRLANPLLLRMAAKAEWIPVGKQPNHHPIPQDQINRLLVEKAREGKRVVRLKGGDPFIFGRGGEEALTLAEAGIRFEIIPGVTSAISVPAYAGVPLTQRDVACSAAVITGHRARWVRNPEDDWQRCSLGADTLVFLMGVKNLPRIVESLLEAGRLPETPIALVEQGATAAQKTISGTLENIVERAADIRPPAVIVVGEVVRLREKLRWFDRLEERPLFGLRVLNTKTISLQEGDTPLGKMIPLDDFDNQVFALGGESIHMPVIQVTAPTDPAPLREALARLAGERAYDWLIFTSANAVTAAFEALTRLGFDARWLHGVRIAAVGKATLMALQNVGIRADFIPDRYTGAELGRQLPLETGQRLLLPRSEIALPALPEILARRGGIVEDVPAYTVQTAPPDPVVLEQLAGGEINVVAFFSPSGIAALTEMLATAGYSSPLPEVLAPLTVACIGPSTAQAAQEAGLHVDIIPSKYTAQGLVEVIVKWRKHS